MEIEHDVKMFKLDKDYEANLKAMSAEGWMLVPGQIPVAIYHVIRVKGLAPGAQPGGEQVEVATPTMPEAPPESAHRPVARLHIDETKIGMRRGDRMLELHEEGKPDPVG